MASTAVTAIAVTLIGIGAGVATWMAGIVIFGAFVGGVAFTSLGVHMISEAF